MNEWIQWVIGFLGGALFFTVVLVAPPVSLPVFRSFGGMAVAAFAYLVTQTKYRIMGYGMFLGLIPAVLIAFLT